MTSLTLHTPTVASNVFASLPSVASLSKEAASLKTYLSFSSKSTSRKSASKLFSIDWDLNRNELEFE